MLRIAKLSLLLVSISLPISAILGAMLTIGGVISVDTLSHGFTFILFHSIEIFIAMILSFTGYLAMDTHA